MIIISNTTADPTGPIQLRNYQLSGEYDSTARISRTATLDGSSHFDHFGVSDTDRNFSIQCRLTMTEQSLLKSLYESGASVRISFWEGCFSGYIAGLKILRSGEATVRFYFRERLA